MVYQFVSERQRKWWFWQLQGWAAIISAVWFITSEMIPETLDLIETESLTVYAGIGAYVVHYPEVEPILLDEEYVDLGFPIWAWYVAMLEGLHQFTQEDWYSAGRRG